MNKNLDLTKILKYCPKGTKFYSTIYGEVEFIRIDKSIDYPIDFNTFDGYTISLTSDGRCNKSYDGECTLFPSKDQRDWSKWHRPFKECDVIISDMGDIHLLRTSDSSYCAYRESWGGTGKSKFDSTITTNIKVYRLATKEEEQKLFNAIKSNGYTWNFETKTLEKLIEPKFKIGDIIHKDGYNVKITEVNVEDECYEYESIIVKGIGGIAFIEQNDWKLVPNKFDPNTLIPFESKVLVRDSNHLSWRGSIYTHRDENNFYTVNGTYYLQCIPYNDDTSYLIGTCKIAPEYYIYWENKC